MMGIGRLKGEEMGGDENFFRGAGKFFLVLKWGKSMKGKGGGITSRRNTHKANDNTHTRNGN